MDANFTVLTHHSQMAAIYIPQYTSPLLWNSLLTKSHYSYSSLEASVFNLLFCILPKHLEVFGVVNNIQIKFSISPCHTGRG